jgi:hypothetical protein
MINSISFAQYLEKHIWKERVLLVFSKDEKSEKSQKQLEILSKGKKGLSERKLEIYSFTPELFTINFQKYWRESTYLFKKHGDLWNDFQVILIGLDGRVKMKQTSVLELKELFARIEGMPMRKIEVRNEN